MFSQDEIQEIYTLLGLSDDESRNRFLEWYRFQTVGNKAIEPVFIRITTNTEDISPGDDEWQTGIQSLTK